MRPLIPPTVRKSMSNPTVTRSLGRAISTLVVAYLGIAEYVCAYDIGYNDIWLQRGRRVYAASYMLMTTILIAAIARTYLYLMLLPSDHCLPPASPTSIPGTVLSTLQIPLQCDPSQPLGPVRKGADLDLPRCERRCRSGAGWKPGKTRHCNVCGVCRVGFDHHCPWFNNCLTLPHMKAFLLLLLLTPPAITLMAIPPFFLVRQDLALIAAWDLESGAMTDAWWGRWYSWLMTPIGRWQVGTIWGYWTFPKGREGEGGRVPSLGLFVTFAFAWIIVAVAASLAVVNIRMLSKGELMMDRLARKSLNKTRTKLKLANKIADDQTRGEKKNSNVDEQGSVDRSLPDNHEEEKTPLLDPASAALNGVDPIPPLPNPNTGITIKLFFPNPNPSTNPNATSEFRGEVELFPPTYRGRASHPRSDPDPNPHSHSPSNPNSDEGTEPISLLRAVWEGPFFPSYSECHDWTRERVEGTVRMQGYM